MTTKPKPAVITSANRLQFSNAEVYTLFSTDPDSQKTSYFYQYYLFGRAGVRRPGETNRKADAAWRAGRDNVKEHLAKKCEACDETNAEQAFCEGCDCCSECCNCTRTDCDCDPCMQRRSNNET